jgi:hypothetical protein
LQVFGDKPVDDLVDKNPPLERRAPIRKDRPREQGNTAAPHALNDNKTMIHCPMQAIMSFIGKRIYGATAAGMNREAKATKGLWLE